MIEEMIGEKERIIGEMKEEKEGMTEITIEIMIEDIEEVVLQEDLIHQIDIEKEIEIHITEIEIIEEIDMIGNLDHMTEGIQEIGTERNVHHHHHYHLNIEVHHQRKKRNQMQI